MRYKTRRRYKSRVVKMKFQSFFDMSTKDGEMQIISVSAGGNDVLRRLAPFFAAYKYYKLGGVSFKAIPASTLPVDPSQLSIQAGENVVDPRDQLTPGMARITNGEDILEDITGLTAEQQHELYNNMLLDPRWFKWMLQTGVKRYAKPKYWQVGQLHQDKWPGMIQNYPVYEQLVEDYIARTGAMLSFGVDGEHAADTAPNVKGGSDPRGFFQTGHRGTLGWLPTDGLQEVGTPGGSPDKKPFIAAIPEIELFKILTPPAYQTKYWYRVFVTETVYFKDPIVMNVNGYRPIDVFHNVAVPSPNVPTQRIDLESDASLSIKTGGNDGSN